MDKQKKQLQHNVTGRECRRDARGLDGLPQVAAEVLEGYLSGQGEFLRSVRSKPQAGLSSLQHQSSKGTQITSSGKKCQGFSLC